MKKIHLLSVAGWLGLVALSSAVGCVDFEGYDGGGYYSSGSDTYDETEDKLFVSGSGENLTLEYNTLTFPARLNWTDGNYYFAPDADGTKSGSKIVCVAAIDDGSVEGDCFRAGRVCHFSYYSTWTESEGKDAYYASTTSCKTAADVGPFLVPLEAPVCGEDPFPACPSDDLFPSGPSEDAGDAVDASVVDDVIQDLCAAAVRCDATLTLPACVAAMEGEAGKQIWDNLGFAGPENEKTAAQIRQAITDGAVTVAADGGEACLHELGEACDAEGESFAIGSYDNVENLIPEGGACASLLAIH